MHSVKLTVLIEDTADLDMEVRVVAPDIPVAATASRPAMGRPVAVPSARSIEDDYALGGYAGI
ncbi:MAG: hypothetical protein ABWZ54_02225 [Luteibacter sp.]|jgi:broad specificity polyphosphatase/5'/3'-nucleotidase SurE